MRLDFNEANILIQTIEDLEKYKKPVNKNTIIGFLNELARTTESKHVFIIQSIKSLSFKIERLSDKSITQLQADVKNNKVVATARYVVPNL